MIAIDEANAHEAEGIQRKEKDTFGTKPIVIDFEF
jgi:hypothetical protein